MNVTVFGSARPKPGDSLYEEAFELGTLLGQAGHTVITGGYGGTMEAVSRGASEAGAHVIGVTCEEIECWRSTPANPWVKHEMQEQTLIDRMMRLMDQGDAFVALPGGVGTFSEIILLWNHLVIDAVLAKPVILIGPGWKQVFDQFFMSFGHYISEEDRKYLVHTDNIHTVKSLLNER